MIFGKKIWAIGGGKGGVGKSIITANMGIALARMGKKVIIVDADLGGSNLHVIYGLRAAKYTLNDFLQLNVPLTDILQEVGVENLKLISGASAILGLANPKYVQKIKTINHILRLDADYILLDLGAGTSFNTLDFYSIANERLVVITPDPTSIQNAYGFVKTALFRKLTRTYIKNEFICGLLQELGKPKSVRNVESMAELIRRLESINGNVKDHFVRQLESFKPQVIVNMLANQEEQESVEAVKLVARKYLNLKMNFLGCIYLDPLIRKSVKTMTPLLMQSPYSAPAREIERIVVKLLDSEE